MFANQRIRLFNTAAGFYVPMIVTPEFLVSEATEKGIGLSTRLSNLKGEI